MIDHIAICEKLKNLYAITEEDWHVHINFSLTEPYAPACVITPDNRQNSTRYAAWGNTVEEAVNKAVDALYQEVILGKRGNHGAPWTNPDDHKPEPSWLPPKGEHS